MDRKISIIEESNKKKIVVIHDIKFKGKRKIEWDDIENYLKKFVGEHYEIDETAEKIYIGKDFPDEYAGKT